MIPLMEITMARQDGRHNCHYRRLIAASMAWSFNVELLTISEHAEKETTLSVAILAVGC